MLSQSPAFGQQDGNDLAKQQAESAMQQVRQANSIMDGIARQFPAAAKEVEAVKAAMVQVLTRIVGSQSRAVSQPSTGVMG